MLKFEKTLPIGLQLYSVRDFLAQDIKGTLKKVKETSGGRCPTLDIVRALAADPLDFEPGTRYQYSLCLDVVGGLVELVSGISLGQYMRENIFEPLGMYRTSFGMTEEKKAMMNAQYEYDAVNKRAMEIPVTANAFNFGPEYESGGAGLISSVDDQILLADALTHLGLGKNGNRILSRFGVEMMRANSNSKQRFGSPTKSTRRRL